MIVVCGWYLIDRFSLSKVFPYYPVTADKDSTLTIGIIGDSWVEGEKLDSIIHRFLLAANFNNKTISSGQREAKSKSVYQNLFKGNHDPYSSKFIIETRPDCCIVIAGVNDASGQMGANFYSYHIKQIIKTLLHYGIKPLIVSLPEFGIEETPANMNGLVEFFWKLRNKTFANFNNHGEIDNIKTYRKDLLNELVSESLKDSVVIVDFDSVCIDYAGCPQLYADRGHLSKYGKEKLCQVITAALVNTITAQKQSAVISLQ